MRVQHIEPVLSPEPLIRVRNDKERRTEDTRLQPFLQIFRIDLRAFEHPCHRQHRIKTVVLERHCNHGIIGDIAVLFPDRFQQVEHQPVKIAATGLLRGNHCIGGWRHIGRPESRLKLHRFAGLGRETLQLLHTIDLARLGTLRRTRGTDPVEHRQNIERFVAHACTMLLRDTGKAFGCEIGERGQKRKIIVDMCHFAPSSGPWGCFQDANRVVSDVNVTIP